MNTFSQASEPQTTMNSSLSHAPSHAANDLCPEPHLAARIDFFHATLFLPEISTFCSAIDAGLLHSLPENITSSQVRKHLFFSETMHKGHLDQERQGIRSTKLQEPIPTLQHTAKNQELIELSKDDTNLLQSCNYPSPIEQRTTNLYFACHESMGNMYTDPTGRFLVPSTKGNKYILCWYDYDSNHVFAEPMKNRKRPAKSRLSRQSSEIWRRQYCDLLSTS